MDELLRAGPGHNDQFAIGNIRYGVEGNLSGPDDRCAVTKREIPPIAISQESFSAIVGWRGTKRLERQFSVICIPAKRKCVAFGGICDGERFYGKIGLADDNSSCLMKLARQFVESKAASLFEYDMAGSYGETAFGIGCQRDN